ncbi:PREDICTED: protein HOTHEAD [Tarenaya hassleriana]|uniref:protein HOTHEAD n=1 Tax=Tarenaya hassleriana TaxID=28532 RepID=UPI00053C2F03|nr:PREDICTED: protein HOTHEAD [Tarenaya hassleriana]
MDHGDMLWLWRLVLGLALFLHPPTAASEKAPNYSFMHDATRAPTTSYYDYIIIGGGTAGCPLAATLSRNASVLLLERGGSPYHNPNITRLTAFGAALSDLSPKSPSQRFVSEDGVINARARVLGGGSALNAGFYTRASLQYVRAMGWDERLVNESYRWVEKKVAFEPPMGRWQTAVRDGLLETGVLPNNGFTFDHINGTKFGGTIFDRSGRRHTAADLLEYADPEGISVFLHATVHRILFQTRGKTKPVAQGVIFRDRTGKAHWAYLKAGPQNEIVVSAGTLGSPQLLMLSGLGPSAHLKAHNIMVVSDMPAVGQGMSDNPMNAVFVPSPVPIDVSLIEVVGITGSGAYIEAAGGENFGAGGSTRDYGMFSPKIGQLSTVPPKRRTPKAIAKAIDSMSKLSSQAFQGGFILEKVMGPLSTGHLELRTRNPNDNPTVTFNYFRDPLDLKRCVLGIQAIAKVIQSKAFTEFKFTDMSFEYLLNHTASAPVNVLPRHHDSATLERFCRDTVMTIWHYHGGCHVGRVVDRDYRVFGVDRLRVIDMSTVSYCPGTNPQATVMMLGRYMGVKILRGRLAKEEINL